MESVTKHDTSSLKLQGPGSLARRTLFRTQMQPSWKHAIWSAVMPHRHADGQKFV